jgi:hypothetical protein
MIRPVLMTVSFLFLSVAMAEDAPDWSKFAKYGEISGVIVKAGDEDITLQIPKLEKGKNNNRGGNRGGRNRRPSVKLGHEDIDLNYAPAGLVRWDKLPKNPDGSPLSSRAMEALRKPIGAPGYAADKADLKPGHVVKVQLVRPTEIPADKVTEKNVNIKYVIIVAEANPPKAEKKDDPKKKKD